METSARNHTFYGSLPHKSATKEQGKKEGKGLANKWMQ